MTIAKRFYQLQEVDQEIDTYERAISQIAGQVGESEVVNSIRQRLALECQQLEELKQQQRSIEWEIDEITGKMSSSEKELYGGKITNPKELTNLQREIGGLKSKRGQLEDRVLAIMGQADEAAAIILSRTGELEEFEAEWRNKQQELSASMGQLRTIRAEVENRRQLLVGEIEPQEIDVYHELKKQKGTAVAKVEQGICRGCRISLPLSELRLARGGNLVRCSSCGRILFLA
ncbi:zinc ribbon domain-containing protein [Chloroflexota bacterium]